MRAGRLRLANPLEAVDIFLKPLHCDRPTACAYWAMRVLTIQEVRYVAARATSILLAAYSVTEKAAE
jgi:hypothetical protein